MAAQMQCLRRRQDRELHLNRVALLQAPSSDAPAQPSESSGRARVQQIHGRSANAADETREATLAKEKQVTLASLLSLA